VCTIVFAWQWCDDAALVLAANRDELVTRPSDPPRQLRDRPPLWGGRDRLAGGTWLAVDPAGRVCAVTNRHPGGHPPPRDPRRLSRGRLPTAVLAAQGDRGAEQVLGTLRHDEYNPVNVLYVSRSGASWVGLDDAMGRRSARLRPGVHVLTEQDPDDPTSRKATRLLEEAQRLATGTRDSLTLVDRFRELLASHERNGGGPESAACIHEQRFGTVSSATVVVADDSVRFEHAEGHPCVTPYQRVLPQDVSREDRPGAAPSGATP
jgi:uncharacterized protein with NRDE domain